MVCWNYKTKQILGWLKCLAVYKISNCLFPGWTDEQFRASSHHSWSAGNLSDDSQPGRVHGALRQRSSPTRPSPGNKSSKTKIYLHISIPCLRFVEWTILWYFIWFISYNYNLNLIHFLSFLFPARRASSQMPRLR